MTCRKKRVAALCLAVLLLCGAAACDRTPAESGNTSAAESAVSTAPQESGDRAPTDGSDPAAPTVPDSPSQSRSRHDKADIRCVRNREQAGVHNDKGRNQNGEIQ